MSKIIKVIIFSFGLLGFIPVILASIHASSEIVSFITWASYPSRQMSKIADAKVQYGSGRECSSHAVGNINPSKDQLYTCFSKSREKSRVFYSSIKQGFEHGTAVYSCEGDGFVGEIRYHFYSFDEGVSCSYRLAPDFQALVPFKEGDLAFTFPDKGVLLKIMIDWFGWIATHPEPNGGIEGYRNVTPSNPSTP